MQISKIVGIMRKEAEKRRAPVFRAESAVKGNPLRTLFFVMLSSRTRDEKTISATKRLFSEYNNARAIAKADTKKIEKLIYGVGFYRQKARRVKHIAKYVAEHGIPKTRDALMKLPGVGIKTANIVASLVHGENRIGVDTHVHRISNRLGIVKTKKPEETEKMLYGVAPKKLWRSLNVTMVAFGQTVCRPRPLCNQCPISRICPKIGVNIQQGPKGRY